MSLGLGGSSGFSRSGADRWAESVGLGTTILKRILIVVGGQSIRQGSGRRYVASLGATTSPAAYVPVRTRSLANGQQDPIAPAKGPTGSWWPQVIDILAANEIDADVVNCSIGGSSIKQWSGAFKSWAANTRYCATRSAENGDAGDKGEFIVAGGKVWRCSTGAKRTAFGTTFSYVTQSGAQVSGAVAPDWASVTTVGGTLADGTLVWTLVENGNSNGWALTSAVPKGNATFFDPLGLHARMLAAATAAKDDAAARGERGYDEVVYLWGNGSSDAAPLDAPIFYANHEIAWRDRLKQFTEWALYNAGANAVGLGLDPWFPDLGQTEDNLTAQRQTYDVLDRGLERAITSYQGGPADGLVFRMANLYRLFGFNPPVYPEAGTVLGVHITDEGNKIAGAEEARLLLLRSAGAIVVPYVEPLPVQPNGVLVGKPVNAPFIHISNSPVVSATVGQTLSLFDGNWAGGWVTSGARQWYRDGVAISGATGATYTLVGGDSGKTITALASKVNAMGTGTYVTPAGVLVS